MVVMFLTSVLIIAVTIAAVTGGAGFLGSHLCTYLVERGDEVLCLDNYFTGDKDNIGHLRQKPNFEVIRHDIVESILLEVPSLFPLRHSACVLHTVCIV